MGNKHGRTKDSSNDYLVDDPNANDNFIKNDEEFKEGTLESRIKNNITNHLGSIESSIIDALNKNKERIIEGLLEKEFLVLYTSNSFINYTYNFPYPIEKSMRVHADFDINIRPIKYKNDVEQITDIWKKNMYQFVDMLYNEGYIANKKNISVDVITNPKTLARKLKYSVPSDMVSNSFIVVTIGTKNFFK